MKELEIYTDGSHLKHTSKRLGCGGILIDPSGSGFGTILDKFSKELAQDWLKGYLGTSEVSNPTAEMLGVLVALQSFNIPGGAHVTLYADYQGVRDWMNGSWRIKERYIKIIKDDIDKIIQTKKINITFAWVKGHQKKSVLQRDAYWNSYVDSLAKGEKE